MTTGPAQLAVIHGRMEKGDLAGALREIDSICASEPRNGAAWHLAGVIRRRTGQNERAVAALETATRLGVRNAELLNSLALACQDIGRLEQARTVLEQAIHLQPDYVPAQVNLGRLLGRLGEYIAAIALLEGTVSRNAGSTLALNALADTLRDSSQPVAASEVYRRVLSRDRANYPASVNLGNVLRDAGRLEEAERHIDAAFRQFGERPELLEAKAGARVDNADGEGARAYIEALVGQYPGYLRGHEAHARLVREFGLEGDPYASFRDLAQAHPGEAAIWGGWLNVMLSFRDYAELVQVAQEARGRVGDLPGIMMVMAIALSELGEREEASRLFEALAAHGGEKPVLLNAWTRHALRCGDAQKAEGLATRVTKADPHDQFGWAYLGTAWRMLGDPREKWLHDIDVQTAQVPIPHLQEAGALERLCDVLRTLHAARHHPPDQSLRGGTQTLGALFARPEAEIVALREGIRAAINQFAAGLPDDPAHPFYGRRTGDVRFTGSWSVRLREEGFHIVHIHERGWISSALHLVVPERREGDDEHAGCLALGEPPAEMGLGLAALRHVRPKPGSLVLFPSSLWHGTVPFSGSAERLTVAFDAVPTT